jgi:hypothetical protein
MLTEEYLKKCSMDFIEVSLAITVCPFHTKKNCHIGTFCLSIYLCLSHLSAEEIVLSSIISGHNHLCCHQSVAKGGIIPKGIKKLIFVVMTHCVSE